MTVTPMQIAVTGLGAVSAAGTGIEPLRQTLTSGISALTPVPAEVAGEGLLWGKTTTFRAADFMPPLKARKFDRCSLFAYAAASMALKDAGIDTEAFGRDRIGICLGCGFGGIDNSSEFLKGYFRSGVEGLAPMLFPNTVPNAPASNASIELGLKGPNVTHVQRFCSAESALMMAYRFLEEGRADAMLTGGTDDLTPLVLQGFAAMGQLRSFGASFGEGAGLLVLEKLERAQSRGARVLAVIDDLRTLGRIPAGYEAEGAARLRGNVSPSLVSLSGCAADMPQLASCVTNTRRVETAPLIGRSLAMGGLSLASLVLSLAPGEQGLHLAASPEGPYYAVDLRGGSPA